MAAIASSLKIIEIESQVWPLSNRNLMVRVQVPFATVVSGTKLSEHLIRRRVAEVEPMAVSHDIWLPSAVYTPPLIPLEAEDPQPAVGTIVSAITA